MRHVRETIRGSCAKKKCQSSENNFAWMEPLWKPFSRKHVCQSELHHSGGMKERRVGWRKRRREVKGKKGREEKVQTGKVGRKRNGKRCRGRWPVVVEVGQSERKKYCLLFPCMDYICCLFQSFHSTCLPLLCQSIPVILLFYSSSFAPPPHC